MVRNSTYNRLLEEFNKSQQVIAILTKQNDILEGKLMDARNMKELLGLLTKGVDDLVTFRDMVSVINGANYTLKLDENVAVFVPDYFVPKNKIIKQEAIKIVEINPDGTLGKGGWTKHKQADTGYDYKIVRLK